MVRAVQLVGVAGRDLEAADALYRDALGLRLVKEGGMPSRGVRAAMLAAGGAYLELIQPLEASSPFATFLEERGEGLHHVALWSDDVDGDVAKLRDCGVTLADPEPRDGFTGRLSYLAADSFGGARRAVVQPGEGRGGGR